MNRREFLQLTVKVAAVSTLPILPILGKRQAKFDPAKEYGGFVTFVAPEDYCKARVACIEMMKLAIPEQYQQKTWFKIAMPDPPAKGTVSFMYKPSNIEWRKYA